MKTTKLPISDKNSIREEARKRLQSKTSEEKYQESKSICEQLLGLQVIKETENIILYEALSDEVSLEYFVGQIQKQGKHIFTIDSNGKSPLILPEEGIILIPGRAFTLSGKRIGRGGGWYDTFLAKNPHLLTIGICFSCQIFPELPQDIWDIPMNQVVLGK